MFLTYNYVRFLFWLVGYFDSLTSSWLSTLALPATDLASCAILVFSSAVLTGPSRVTWPFTVMILMFCAVTERLLSFTIARRISAVIFTSSGLFDWSPDVLVSPDRSRSFCAVLSTGGVLSSANSLVRQIAPEQAKVSKVRFME